MPASSADSQGRTSAARPRPGPAGPARRRGRAARDGLSRAERQHRRQPPAVRRLDSRQLLRRRRPGPAGADGSAAALSTSSCRDWPRGRRRAIPACTRWRPNWSRTATTASTSTCCVRSCSPTRNPIRCASARSGRSRSCCGWRWSSACACWPTRSCEPAWIACVRRRSSRKLEQQAAAKRGRLWRWRSEVELPESFTPPFVVELLRRLRDRPPSMAPAWAQLLEPLTRSGRRRRDDPAGGAAGSVDAGVDWQCHHQHADAVGAGLADLCRARQPRRARAARRSGRRVRANGLCHARSVSTVGRAARARLALLGDRGRPARVRPGGARPARRARPPSGATTSATTWSRAAGSSSNPICGTARAKRERFARFVFRHPALGYLGADRPADHAGRREPAGQRGPARRVVRRCCCWSRWPSLVPLSELAINLINRLVTAFVPPRPLPKLDYRAGIPESDRTIVVVPVLIGSADKVPDLLAQLEVRYLGNADSHVHFAVLSDFHDADAETAPDDAAIIEAATRGVQALNERHGAGPLPLPASRPTPESRHRPLDGLGTQARQDRRVQPARAGPHRHVVRRARWARSASSPAAAT